MRKNKALNNAPRATLKDIAAIVGVSPTAVSQALNGKGALTEELRERIKETARSLDYSPNPAARILRGVRSNSIGVVINYFNNPFFRAFLGGLEEVLGAAGLTYSVSQTHDRLDKEQELVRKVAESGADGILLLNCSSEYAHLEAVSRTFSIPIVLISHTIDDKFAAVQADNVRGARLATEHLLDLDDGRPVFHLAGVAAKSGLANRKLGFIEAVRAFRPNLDPEAYCYPVERLTAAAGYQAMERICAGHKPPFGLFVVNDEVALGVLNYCQKHGLRLPEDVAVVGFSDIDLLETLNIPLSSVRIPQQRTGQTAGQVLLDLIAHPENRKCPPIMTLPVSLIVRESSRRD